MFDPVTVAGSAALTEAVKFLYGQLTDVLRRRRERQQNADPVDRQVDGGNTDTNELVVLPGAPVGVIDRPLAEKRVPLNELTLALPQLTQVRRALSDYVDGVATVSPRDQELNNLLAQARGLLEALYSQHVTLAGEAGRPSTGSPLADKTALSDAVVASGDEAIAAHTLSGQAATSGGINIAGGVRGGVNKKATPETTKT